MCDAKSIIESHLPSTNDVLSRVRASMVEHPAYPSGWVQLLTRLIDAVRTTPENIDALIVDAENARDRIWEDLNTGHWKDVAIVWRYSHSVISLCLAMAYLHKQTADDATRLKESLRACDMGLLMGAPICDDVLARLADHLHSLLNDLEPAMTAVSSPSDKPTSRKRAHSPNDKNAQPKLNKSVAIDAVDASFSVAEFSEKYLRQKVPVLIKGAASEWTACQKWSVNHILNVARHRLVPVEVGSRYTDDSWSQQLMTVKQFVEKYINYDRNGEPPGYLAQHQLLDQILSLKRDIVVPDYCYAYDNDDNSTVDDDVDINAWFGPAHTVSPLHHDPRDNLFVQVFGRKQFILIDRTHTDDVYPFTDGMMTNTSQVDVECPDLNSFPRFATTPVRRVLVSAGDMLYIPRKWWHHVRSLDPSFSLSYWFGAAE